MKVQHTNRGFELIEFSDIYGEECSLQQSSLANFSQPGSSAVWLGCNHNKKHSVTGDEMSPRMHLDRRQVKALVKHLTKWLETGYFK